MHEFFFGRGILCCRVLSRRQARLQSAPLRCRRIPNRITVRADTADGRHLCTTWYGRRLTIRDSRGLLRDKAEALSRFFGRYIPSAAFTSVWARYRDCVLDKPRTEHARAACPRSLLQWIMSLRSKDDSPG
ncbi:hypothetical protein ACRALDRAFT_1081704 [Sodiomyces alcalophilus JCM 7366]|uniref:uncharacterized protein n=1 Tax=Sodiomyces alcalophilus JCM 7366 TaxID=591952 RepID=UPI0039B4EC84